jgi:hypothetical protein
MATILCATGDAARSASGRGAYELPPLPPGNGFDVRLANGSRYYIPGQDAGAIRIQGAKLPLTVRWNFDALPGDGGADAGNGGAAAGLVFNSGSTRIELTGSGSAELATAAGLALSPLGSGAGIRIPTGHSLSQNYPNPFNPSTTIRFAVAGPAGGTGTGDAAGAPGSLEARAVTIEVFDVSGGLVATLVDGPLPPGEHTAVWNAAGHPSGIYYCRMNVADATLVKPMLLVR